jgi:UDP-N-acetylglucosamine diphosphorylase/glucosamine-1-phosphate N-acetyltransferase
MPYICATKNLFITLNYILFETTEIRANLLPLTYTRSSATIRCGILTFKEKWEKYLQTEVSVIAEKYLQDLYTLNISSRNYFVNATIFPDDALVVAINNCSSNTILMYNDVTIAICLNEDDANTYIKEGALPNNCQQIQYQFQINYLKNLWDIFSLNDMAIRQDYDLLTHNKTGQLPSKTNTIIGKNIFIEEGAKVEASIINTETGPVYIGKNAEVMEGCIIRGPLVLGEGAQLKMGAKIYGATTLGPGCKVGGEVNNAVFFANSSKAHDGFVGNSVIGEWCNIGADSNNSNLKNNYEEVKLWHEAKGSFVKTGLQFCGLIMADHSKCGINTMFNTGTVIGVSANIFGSGFPRNFVPSFSWGGASGFTEYKLDKAMQTMKLVYARRKKEITETENNIYQHIYSATQNQRNY